MNKAKRFGFTIVELLIVIVVIGILAAITIVAYNGIQQRARASEASSALTQANKKIKLFQVDTPDTPPDCTKFYELITSTTTGSSCSFTSGNIAYQYTPNTTNNTYCITATAGGTTSYKATGTSAPVLGGCDGHSSGGVAAVTNLVQNPSFESNTTSWGVYSATTTMSRETGSGSIGSYRLKLVRHTAGGDAYASHTLSPVAPLSTTFTVSFYVWADAPVNLVNSMLFRHLTTGSTYHTLANSASNYAVTTTPTRVVLTGTTNASASAQGLQVILRLPAAVDVPVYYDGFMITEGSSAPAYGDGNTAGWLWNGTVNNSSSTGPPPS
jgi:prepilin-type N-terminal cleavage/methylation domain-containing protein